MDYVIADDTLTSKLVELAGTSLGATPALNKGYSAYLVQQNWFHTAADLRVATCDPQEWTSLRIPARLRLLLKAALMKGISHLDGSDAPELISWQLQQHDETTIHSAIPMKKKKFKSSKTMSSPPLKQAPNVFPSSSSPSNSRARRREHSTPQRFREQQNLESPSPSIITSPPASSGGAGASVASQLVDSTADNMRKLMDMGFSEALCLEALRTHDYNLDQALPWLLASASSPSSHQRRPADKASTPPVAPAVPAVPVALAAAGSAAAVLLDVPTMRAGSDAAEQAAAAAAVAVAGAAAGAGGAVGAGASAHARAKRSPSDRARASKQRERERERQRAKEQEQQQEHQRQRQSPMQKQSPKEKVFAAMAEAKAEMQREPPSESKLERSRRQADERERAEMREREEREMKEKQAREAREREEEEKERVARQTKQEEEERRWREAEKRRKQEEEAARAAETELERERLQRAEQARLEHMKREQEQQRRALAVIGGRVSVRYDDGQWYEGWVSNYSKETRKHYVRYDDGEEWWQELNEKKMMLDDKAFTFVNSQPGGGAAGPSLPPSPSPLAIGDVPMAMPLPSAPPSPQHLPSPVAATQPHVTPQPSAGARHGHAAVDPSPSPSPSAGLYPRMGATVPYAAHGTVPPSTAPWESDEVPIATATGQVVHSAPDGVASGIVQTTGQVVRTTPAKTKPISRKKKLSSKLFGK